MTNKAQAKHGRRRTRAQWRRLVSSWRRGGQTAEEFAKESGVVEATLRWWAWRLAQDGELEIGAGGRVGLVPVRVVEAEGQASTGASDAAGDHARPGVAWMLRTSRGELRVYARTHCNDELHAAVAALVGDGS